MPGDVVGRGKGRAIFFVTGLVLGAAAGMGLMIWGRDLSAVEKLASLGGSGSASMGGSGAVSGSSSSGEGGAIEGASLSQKAREVLYWYDPMYPGTRFDEPGKSPFMDMDLVPRYADDASGEGSVTIDPVMVQNLGLKTAQVKKGRLSITKEISANVEFNRYLEARVQSRAEGFVSEAGNFAPGDFISSGSLIASITVPAWASDQSEYLLLKGQRADSKLIAGVREKLRLSGMPEDMLREVDETGKVQTAYKLFAPVSGVVTELSVYPGMNVDKSMTMAVIQGIDPIWVAAEVPQRDLGLVEGGRVRVTTPAWPERVFEAKETALLPQANSQTRTVQLRLTVPNPEGLLRPGLTASVRIRKSNPESLIIPTLSLIDLGEEKRVVTRLPDGSFSPKTVRVGASSRGETAVTDGLNEGDEVVVSGLFLIDSEANLAGALDRMSRPGQGASSVNEAQSGQKAASGDEAMADNSARAQTSPAASAESAPTDSLTPAPVHIHESGALQAGVSP